MNATLEKNSAPSTCAAQGTATNRAQYLTPRANVLETKDGYVLQAELPGVSKGGLEITVENGTLTLQGRRSTVEARGRRIYGESRSTDYRRSFELDPSIDASKVAANLEHGVLTLHLPKTEAVKPRKITVG